MTSTGRDPLDSWKLAVRATRLAGLTFCGTGAVLLAVMQVLHYRATGTVALPWGPGPMGRREVPDEVWLALGGWIGVGVAYLALAMCARRYKRWAIFAAMATSALIALVGILICVHAASDRYDYGIGFGAFLATASQAWLLVELTRALRGIRFASAESQSGFVLLAPQPVLPIDAVTPAAREDDTVTR